MKPGRVKQGPVDWFTLLIELPCWRCWPRTTKQGQRCASADHAALSDETLAAAFPDLSREKKDWTRTEDRQELFLPVHGFAWYYPEEIKVIDHPAFQRLAGLHQLGMTNLVYRGATHRRIEQITRTGTLIVEWYDTGA